MSKCEICKYQKDCPDIVEENSVYCLAHRRIPKNFDNEYIEKQQLISFLEEKIREHKLNLLNLKHNIGTTYEEIGKYKGNLHAFQEVLDFVKKSGKE